MATRDMSFKTYGSFKQMNDVKVGSENVGIFLTEEFIDMTFDPEPKSMDTFKGIGCYWT